MTILWLASTVPCLLVVLWWRALRASQARDAQLARDLHETIRNYHA